MMVEIWQAMLMAVITGAVSSIGTVAALKTEIDWIKIILGQHNTRLDKLEERKC